MIRSSADMFRISRSEWRKIDQNDHIYRFNRIDQWINVDNEGNENDTIEIIPNGSYNMINLGVAENSYYWKETLINRNFYLIANSLFHKLTEQDFEGYDNQIVENDIVTGGCSGLVRNNENNQKPCYYFTDNSYTGKRADEYIIRERLVINNKEFKIYWRMSRDMFDQIPQELLE